jgi:FG-GAP repeat
MQSSIAKTPFQPFTADLSNRAGRDKFGHAIALSADGQTLAIGAPYSDQGAYSSGLVQIYRRSVGNWTPIGAPITGTIPLEFLGWSIALSADGQTIAIGATGSISNGQRCGAVRLYRYDHDRWIVIGQPIGGEAADELAGSAIALSADGKILAIGAALNDANGHNSGKVKVYRQPTAPDQPWAQIGGDLLGEAANNYFGSAIGLSADGQHLAIGAPYCSQDNGPQNGAVMLYQQVNANWVNLGRLVGRHQREWFGGALALSSDGQTIAVGAPGHDSQRGAIRVYQRCTGVWQQQGNDRVGLNPGEGLGHAVALSADGNTLAGSTTPNSTDLLRQNVVRLDRYRDQAWHPDTETCGNGPFGQAVALADNGQTLLIGAPGHDQKNPGESGFVRLLARLKRSAKPQIQRHPDSLTLQLYDGDDDRRSVEDHRTPPVTLTYGFGGLAGQPMELDRNWSIIDATSFNANDSGPMTDGRSKSIDVLLHSRSRDEVCRWQLDPNGQITAIQLLQTPTGQVLRTRNPQWRLIGWAAFGQGTPIDLLWHNPTSDEMAFWSLAADRVTVTGYDYLYDRQGTRIKTGNSGWEICAIADLDGNGQPDLLLRLPALNQTAVIRLDGKIFVEAQYLTSPPIADLHYRDMWYWEGQSQATINWQNATQTQVLQQPVNFVNGRFVADQFMPLA